MKKYIVKFYVFDKPFKTAVEATSVEDAKLQVHKLIAKKTSVVSVDGANTYSPGFFKDVFG